MAKGNGRHLNANSRRMVRENHGPPRTVPSPHTMLLRLLGENDPRTVDALKAIAKSGTRQQRKAATAALAALRRKRVSDIDELDELDTGGDAP